MSVQTRGIALVTGAGSGIGRASARALLADGWQVVLAGRRLPPLEETAAGHPAATVLGADVSQPAEVDALFEAILERHGRLDLLFNNAGLFPPGALIDEMTIEAWMQSVAVNLNGAFFCARAAFGLMRRQSPGEGGSSTTAPSQPMCLGLTRWPTPPPSMPSRASPGSSRSMVGPSRLPARRLTLATPHLR